jgi:hypothetical protein
MKVFLIAGAVLAALAAGYYCFALFFTANATAASREAEEEAARAERSKKRRGAGA